MSSSVTIVMSAFSRPLFAILQQSTGSKWPRFKVPALQGYPTCAKSLNRPSLGPNTFGAVQRYLPASMLLASGWVNRTPGYLHSRLGLMAGDHLAALPLVGSSFGESAEVWHNELVIPLLSVVDGSRDEHVDGNNQDRR